MSAKDAGIVHKEILRKQVLEGDGFIARLQVVHVQQTQ